MDKAWRRTAQPTVVDQLQEYLVASGAKPGDRLPTEPEFAAELGVGRSSVREGVQALQAMGIVDVRHGRGTYLSEGSVGGLGSALTFWTRLGLRNDDDSTTLTQIAEVRVVLESALVHRVVDLHTPETLAELDDLAAEMVARAELGTFAPEADRRFHRVLYAPLHNWVLDSIITSFWEAMDRTVDHDSLRGDASRIALVHRDLVAALRARDHTTLDAVMVEHFATMEGWYAH